MFRTIKNHLYGVEESYFKHMYHAFSYGGRMIFGGVCAIIHGIFPNLFQTAASDALYELHAELQARLEKARAKRDAEKT